MKPTPEGDRPKTNGCYGCTVCQMGLAATPYWVTAGGATALIWSPCKTGARARMWGILRTKNVSPHHPWGMALVSQVGDTWNQNWNQKATLDALGIVARPATQDDLDRWADLARQNGIKPAQLKLELGA